MVRNSIILLLVATSLSFAGRKWTSGGEKIRTFDIQFGSFDGWTGYLNSGSGAPNISNDSIVKYSGTYSLGFFRSGCGSGGVAGQGYLWKDITGITKPIYIRAKVRFGGFPDPHAAFCTASVSPFIKIVSATDSLMFRIDSLGKISMSLNATQLARTTTILSVNTWYIFQASTNWATSGASNTMRIGVAGTNETLSDTTPVSNATAPTRFKFGWIDLNSTSAITLNMDDIAINDGSESYENSSPDDSGKVILSAPISDSARTGWIAGGGSTTNLWKAVVWGPATANCGQATDTTLIYDKTASATDNVFFTCQTYSTIGLTTANRIMFVQSMIMGGDSAGTSPLGATSVSSNPAQGGETGFIFGEGDAIRSVSNCNSAIGNNSGFHYEYSSPIYFPAVSLAINPVIMIGKRSATTAKVTIRQAHLLIEYKLVGTPDAQVITY